MIINVIYLLNMKDLIVLLIKMMVILIHILPVNVKYVKILVYLII